MNGRQRWTARTDGRDGRTAGTAGTAGTDARDGRQGRTAGTDGRQGRTPGTDGRDGRQGQTEASRDGRQGQTEGSRDRDNCGESATPAGPCRRPIASRAHSTRVCSLSACFTDTLNWLNSSNVLVGRRQTFSTVARIWLLSGGDAINPSEQIANEPAACP
ncbi:uncharacterized protein LOC144075915 isoform X4 [Stigmatopora argus]